MKTSKPLVQTDASWTDVTIQVKVKDSYYPSSHKDDRDGSADIIYICTKR